MVVVVLVGVQLSTVHGLFSRRHVPVVLEVVFDRHLLVEHLLVSLLSSFFVLKLNLIHLFRECNLFLDICLLELRSIVELLDDVFLIQLHLQLFVVEVLRLVPPVLNHLGLFRLLCSHVAFKAILTVLLGLLRVDVVGQHIVLVVVAHRPLLVLHLSLLQFLEVVAKSNPVDMLVAVDHRPHRNLSSVASLRDFGGFLQVSSHHHLLLLLALFQHLLVVLEVLLVSSNNSLVYVPHFLVSVFLCGILKLDSRQYVMVQAHHPVRMSPFLHVLEGHLELQIAFHGVRLTLTPDLLNLFGYILLS